MRVVYDTNVLVSAALKPGSIPAVLVSLALAQRVHLCVSPPILSEYTAVLHRPKFGFEALSVDTLLADLTRTALLVHPTMPLTVAPPEAEHGLSGCRLLSLWHPVC